MTTSGFSAIFKYTSKCISCHVHKFWWGIKFWSENFKLHENRLRNNENIDKSLLGYFLPPVTVNRWRKTVTVWGLIPEKCYLFMARMESRPRAVVNRSAAMLHSVRCCLAHSCIETRSVYDWKSFPARQKLSAMSGLRCLGRFLSVIHINYSSILHRFTAT